MIHLCSQLVDTAIGRGSSGGPHCVCVWDGELGRVAPAGSIAFLMVRTRVPIHELHSAGR